MMLLIDAGNSRIKLGWLDRQSGAREPEPLAIAHDQVQAARDWVKRLSRAPLAAVGGNVAGAALAERLQAALGLPIHWIRASACAGGVRNGYATPSQLGADRWLALIGLAARAAHEPETPLMLASYGTATTIDALSPQGTDGVRTFVGGLILPGASLMRAALAQHTANLPLAQGAAIAFPTNTDQAIVSGVCAAQAGALAQQWRHAFTRFGRLPALYASGGDWRTLAHAVEAAITQTRADLGLLPAPIQTLTSPVLDGLARLGFPLSGS